MRGTKEDGEKKRTKSKTCDRRTNTLDEHMYIKATTSATDVREDKVISPFLLSNHMCACVSRSEKMMTSVGGERKIDKL